jgi:hypothetical protein
VGFGSDVSSQRLTPFEEQILDRASQRQALSPKPLVAVDLFSGFFASNAHRLATIGYQSYAIDFSPQDSSLDDIVGKRLATGGSLVYICEDVRNVSFHFLRKQLDLVTAQRSLHF